MNAATGSIEPLTLADMHRQHRYHTNQLKTLDKGKSVKTQQSRAKFMAKVKDVQREAEEHGFCDSAMVLFDSEGEET